MTPLLVVLVVLLVGVYDIGIGLEMLLSDAPWTAHGPGTVWADVPQTPGTLSLFRRIGAFSLHAGVVTVVLALLGRRRPWLMTVLFVTYLITGMGFFTTDQAFFQGTPYLARKGLIGTGFALAFVVHLGWQRWGRATPPPGTTEGG